MQEDFDTLDNLPTIQGDDGKENKLLADRYKITRKVGEGGMGMVYLAEDTELGNNKVAIKFIPPQLAGNARAIKNLKKEAQTSMQLSHPNIVRLHDLHTDGHQKFLVMEYIEGKTLDDLLAEKEEGKLTLEELLPIAEQIALGLDFAHSKKVLHRDLKPSNIMIDKNGTVKLLDFGIAREIKDSYTRVTGKETSGTLPYTSPEQLMGEKPTPAMDIYSFGAVIYECLSSHPPFYMGDIREQIRLRDVEIISEISDEMNKILLLSLSKESEKRYKKANDLIEQLRIVDAIKAKHKDKSTRSLKMDCPKCNKEVQTDWKTCPFCGMGLIPMLDEANEISGRSSTEKADECLDRKLPHQSGAGEQIRRRHTFLLGFGMAIVCIIAVVVGLLVWQNISNTQPVEYDQFLYPKNSNNSQSTDEPIDSVEKLPKDDSYYCVSGNQLLQFRTELLNKPVRIYTFYRGTRHECIASFRSMDNALNIEFFFKKRPFTGSGLTAWMTEYIKPEDCPHDLQSQIAGGGFDEDLPLCIWGTVKKFLKPAIGKPKIVLDVDKWSKLKEKK